VRSFTEADAAHVEVAHVPVLASTKTTTTDHPALVFWFALRADHDCFSCHLVMVISVWYRLVDADSHPTNISLTRPSAEVRLLYGIERKIQA